MRRFCETGLAVALVVGLWVGDGGAAAPNTNPAAVAPAVVLQGKETPTQIQQAYAKAFSDLVPALGTDDVEAVRILESTTHAAARPGAEPEREACCRAMASLLASDAPAGVKVWLLKQLTVIGRAEVVPVLAQLLQDKEPLVRETARRALQHNPSREAGEALRTALEKATEPAWKAALVQALGMQGDAASLAAIAKSLEQSDEAVMAAAIGSLAHLGTPEAAAMLASARTRVPERLRLGATDAYLQCADRMLRDGKSAEGLAIYRELNQPQQPRPIRMAALAGLLRASGDDAGTLIVKSLASGDADARAVATGAIAQLSSGGLRPLAAAFDQLPPAGQSLVLGALTARGEKSALPAALTAVKSSDPELRLTGLRALGRVGDASAVALLLEGMFGEGDAALTARDSLAGLNAEGVDPRILGALQAEKDAARRVALIDLVMARRTAAAVPTLLQDATGDQVEVRSRAIEALGQLAEPAHVAAMLPALLKAEKGRQRDDVEKAILVVCQRAPGPQQADAVIAAFQKAAPADQIVLLPLVGRIGGSKALEVVRAAMDGSDASLRDAGLRGLCNWPDDSVADQLFKLSQTIDIPEQRVWALRAFVRVVTLPGGRSTKAKLALLKQAMEMASRDEDRRLILERASGVRSVETLRFVMGYVGDPALAGSVCKAVVELAHHRDVRGRNRAEFENALKNVIRISRKGDLVDRAKRYLKE